MWLERNAHIVYYTRVTVFKADALVAGGLHGQPHQIEAVHYANEWHTVPLHDGGENKRPIDPRFNGAGRKSLETYSRALHRLIRRGVEDNALHTRSVLNSERDAARGLN